MKYPLFFVFDVESIGLYGESFAVGSVVIQPDGTELFMSIYAVERGLARGEPSDRAWCDENIPTIAPTDLSLAALRTRFWRDWIDWRTKGAVMAADCPHPVETGFLRACIRDDPSRSVDAPYPLFDVASIIFAAGGDPMATNDRLPHELPQHNPLADARQSARLLVEAIRRKDKPVQDVLAPSNCNKILRERGLPYPRTCAVCGLGPCAHRF